MFLVNFILFLSGFLDICHEITKQVLQQLLKLCLNHTEIYVLKVMQLNKVLITKELHENILFGLPGGDSHSFRLIIYLLLHRKLASR